MPRTETAYLTVAQAADHLGIGEDAIIGHIRAGRLRAANVGLGTRRPRWRITAEALDAFVESRTSTPMPVKRPQRKRRAGITEYIR